MVQIYIQGDNYNQWWPALECQSVPIMKCIENEKDEDFTTKNSVQEFSSTVKFVNKEECYLLNNDTKMKRLVIFYKGVGEFPKHDGPIKI